jgi:hypothetical protein
MEAHYRAFGGRIVVKVEASNIKDLIKQISPVAEILDADNACGKCGSEAIYPRCRTVGKFDYFELKCGNAKCGAALSFGQLKEGGGLFAKRKDDAGNLMDSNGWHIYLGLPAAENGTPAAPPPGGPRTAPAPGNGNGKRPTDPPELVTLLLELQAAESGLGKEEVYSRVYQRIVSTDGEETAFKAWTAALGKFGDPDKKPGAAPLILRHLYEVATAKV